MAKNGKVGFSFFFDMIYLGESKTRRQKIRKIGKVGYIFFSI